MKNDDIIYGLSEISLYLSNIGREDFAQTIEDTCKIITLLKERETVPVHEDKINKCECGETVCRYWHPKFCGFCGKELLWY